MDLAKHRVWSTGWLNPIFLGVRPAVKNWYNCRCSCAEAIKICEVLLDCCSRVEKGQGAEKVEYLGFELWFSTHSARVTLSCGRTVRVATEHSFLELALISDRSYSIYLSLADALNLACDLWNLAEDKTKAGA